MTKKKENFDRYCKDCGRKMIMSTKSRRINSNFDYLTGKILPPEMEEWHFWQCPEWVPFFSLFKGHEKYDDTPVAYDF